MSCVSVYMSYGILPDVIVFLVYSPSECGVGEMQITGIRHRACSQGLFGCFKYLTYSNHSGSSHFVSSPKDNRTHKGNCEKKELSKTQVLITLTVSDFDSSVTCRGNTILRLVQTSCKTFNSVLAQVSSKQKSKHSSCHHGRDARE